MVAASRLLNQYTTSTAGTVPNTFLLEVLTRCLVPRFFVLVETGLPFVLRAALAPVVWFHGDVAGRAILVLADCTCKDGLCVWVDEQLAPRTFRHWTLDEISYLADASEVFQLIQPIYRY